MQNNVNQRMVKKRYYTEAKLLNMCILLNFLHIYAAMFIFAFCRLIEIKDCESERKSPGVCNDSFFFFGVRLIILSPPLNSEVFHMPFPNSLRYMQEYNKWNNGDTKHCDDVLYK